VAERDGGGGGGDRRVARDARQGSSAGARAARGEPGPRGGVARRAAQLRRRRRAAGGAHGDVAPGKTGASMGLEQLRVLSKAEDHILKPWLEITGLFFAGEVPDELKLGVVSPLAKDEEKFRPVVLLEPLYKVCMATCLLRWFYRGPPHDTLKRFGRH